jgi:hypothetical protein
VRQQQLEVLSEYKKRLVSQPASFHAVAYALTIDAEGVHALYRQALYGTQTAV